MSQTELKYNPNDPEGQWRILRDDISAADGDFVASQTRPPDDLLLGTPPPGPATFEGIRFFLAFYEDSDPSTIIPGGTWDFQPIEIGAIPPPSVINQPVAVLGGDTITGTESLQIITLGGWREAAFSLRVSALVFPGSANRARIYVREF